MRKDVELLKRGDEMVMQSDMMQMKILMLLTQPLRSVTRRRRKHWRWFDNSDAA